MGTLPLRAELTVRSSSEVIPGLLYSQVALRNPFPESRAREEYPISGALFTSCRDPEVECSTEHAFESIKGASS